MVSPAAFIPLFEETGDIYEIDKYVWRETVRQITEWREKYGITLPVSVNLSRIDVLNPTLEQTLDEILKEFNLEPKFLKLEITESAYIKNTDLLNDIILRLRAKGHEIEMDDFGTGYSSLNMLSSIPIDVLKMDMAFVRNITHSEKDMRLVELILDIANNLQISVIAEGVETEAQMTILKQAGCQMVQGNYFSRPVSPEKFEKFIG